MERLLSVEVVVKVTTNKGRTVEGVTMGEYESPAEFTERLCAVLEDLTGFRYPAPSE